MPLRYATISWSWKLQKRQYCKILPQRLGVSSPSVYTYVSNIIRILALSQKRKLIKRIIKFIKYPLKLNDRLNKAIHDNSFAELTGEWLMMYQAGMKYPGMTCTVSSEGV